ncbi:MAG: M15 family metallopeptidase [Clostridium sp.]|nr:M15 family metallopeptidase [Clostridium sp.]MCM1569048.1 M15 family metallopeptidase [Roseburia sp.]
MNIDKEKIIKMGLTLLGILLFVIAFRFFTQRNSLSLSEYAAQNPELNKPLDTQLQELPPEGNDSEADTIPINPENDGGPEEDFSEGTISDETIDADKTTENLQPSDGETEASGLIGASLNGASQEENRVTCQPSFYYEPLSDNLRRYITGVSYPNTGEAAEEPVISLDELSYVHILHYDFEGNPAEGELICNRAIAQDLTEIFYELYANEYQLEKVRLIDEYDGDDTASMEDNNTSCFNYRNVDNSTRLSKHAYGLAIDINPFYNPYVTYEADGSEKISPVAAINYADRSASFPYKIDENDLCYKLFKEHGFTWGGNWNSSKDYQHFQKALTN